MRGDSRRRLAHAPRRPVEADSTFTALLARNVSRDSRVAKLPAGGRWALVIAAIHFTDATGRFWPKLRVLADTAGLSRSVVGAAMTAAVDLGIVTREPHARPDGKQGSSTYRWHLALVPPTLSMPEREAQGRERTRGKRQVIDGVMHEHDGTQWVEVTG